MQKESDVYKLVCNTAYVGQTGRNFNQVKRTRKELEDWL